MKVTVEVSDGDLQDVLELTGERKKGPAIRLLMEQALQLRRRQRIVERFLSGEWGVQLEGFEQATELERQRLLDVAD
jgi:Mn-dependent DtxR family transcriptional regulator